MGTKYSGVAHLKSTQTYTREFGVAVAEGLMEVRCFYDDLQCTRGQLHNVPEDLEDKDCWQDAELDDVLRVLQDRHCVK